jgi:hypothetical protein
MKRVEAKILENEPEDPRTEPDQEPNTWLIQGKLSEDVLDWENVRLGKSPLKKGDLVHVDIR